MRHSQLLFFKAGCWVALATAAVHMFGHLSGPLPPANETEQMLADMASSYQFPLPGGGHRSLMEFLEGFSLSFTLLLATIGGTGFLVLRRSRDDSVLMTALARALASFSLVLLVISLTHWFIVPSAFIGVMAVSFSLASLGRVRGRGSFPQIRP